MKRVLIDMDEVIADPMGAMITWYEKEYGGKVDYSKMDGSWAYGFPEEHRHLIRPKLNEPGFFRHLPVMKDAVAVLEEINKKYELFIVSAAMEFPNSLKDKLEWLGDHFPFITWQQVTLCGDKRLVSGDFMIDDHTKNLDTFGGKQYLFTSPHNLSVDKYDRINSWEEAAKIFLS
ncbi:5'(3')-deoxyribonucleotidase [Pseudoflavitalea sp. G-6-1-2]|uniref:5' nucleotidase, NT5C type n=1 Tax=Pseudoflavitalea sp. G-6-1-2 TaxID=2728841 RepID=UPI00146B6770|nr:5'(3')-deoxyribonucleotidase [Pseudoflavitalea sp. G-6-1-2]NML22742.1 5'(3')-deoxyribonucleotidase [Pseudoflavitalea sp. G-6-1-2]